MYCSSLYSIVYFVGNTAKGRISKRVFQENKARQIFRKTNISYPLIRTRTCAYRGKKCSFFGKFDVPCFLEKPVLRFALLLYYRRFFTSKFAAGYRDTNMLIFFVPMGCVYSIFWEIMLPNTFPS